MPQKYIEIDSIIIERYPDHELDPPMSRVFNEDGDFVHAFPSDWTNEQIKTALKFANTVYSFGYERGQQDKAYQVRSALGIATSIQ